MKIQEALEILMKIKLQFGDDLEIVVQSVDLCGYDDASIVIEPLAERETQRHEHEGLYIDQPIWGEQIPQEKFKNRVAFIRATPANPDLIIQPEGIGIDKEALYKLWSGQWKYPGEEKC